MSQPLNFSYLTYKRAVRSMINTTVLDGNIAQKELQAKVCLSYSIILGSLSFQLKVHFELRNNKVLLIVIFGARQLGYVLNRIYS